MHFEQVARKEYKNNTLFNVVFQARFPEILKISHEAPVQFQDIVRKQGYPESVSAIPALPANTPNELKQMMPFDQEYHFYSEDKVWQLSLSKNFVALACNGDYKNYPDFRARLITALQTFCAIYEPSYFTRVGLRYQDIANEVFLPDMVGDVNAFVPNHVFPELRMPIAGDIENLHKVSRFTDGDMKVTVSHLVFRASGAFGRRHVPNKKSYLIDIDCYTETKPKGINDVLSRCDTFKQHIWNIFQWSITDELRTAMGEPGQSES